MDSSSRYNRALQLQIVSGMKQKRSGYEPSDTETDWHESPWRETDKKNETSDHEEPNAISDQARSESPLRRSRRSSGKLKLEDASPTRASVASPARRRHSKSPYEPRSDDVRPVSPFSKSEHRRHISPYKTEKDDQWLDDEEVVRSNRKHRPGNNDVIQLSEKSNYIRRAASAPRVRLKDKDSFKYDGSKERKRADRNPPQLQRKPSRKERDGSYPNNPSGGEINEMLANVKISRASTAFPADFESTDSIAPGDIFFSRDYTALTTRNSMFLKNSGTENMFSQKPENFTDRIPDSYQRNKFHFDKNIQVISASTVSTQTTDYHSAISRQNSNVSDYSGRTNGSGRKFTANRQKNHTEAWFSCMKKGCRNGNRSPEKERASYEASVIEKAFVVECLGQFWADKHRPASLNGFSCHKQEALLLKQLASNKIFPHILLKGPPGSGKKALTMALLHEIYGPSVWNISHDMRYFHVQETTPMEVVVPISSSRHHVEINVQSEANAIYALMAIVKQICAEYDVIPEISKVNMKPDYKVIVLYDVDKAADNIQHLIKWIMDGYSEACKLILSCEDDVDILEAVKSRCKIIKVEPPVTHEIMEVLIQISRKEDFELSMSFAAKVANKSKQNMRRAIMALEACKAHNYPFAEDQPIPLGWEEALVEVTSEILADPSPKRLFIIRGRFQKLLADFVHPKLILLKLVEQFLKGVEAGSKRELYYWHAYYDKRLPPGTSALLKLEEFMAKFMSIHRRNCSHRQVSRG